MEPPSKQISSEEKLLRLIRQKKTPILAAEPKFVPSGQAKLISSSSDKNGDVAEKFLKNFNHLLVIAVLGAAVYVGSDYYKNRDNRNTPFPVEVKSTVTEPASATLALPEQKPFEYYQDKIAARNIFQAPWEKSSTNNPTSPVNLSKLTDEISVVGIIIDKDPKVIVLDKKKNETQMLSKGETIKGATLETIEDSRVIFSYNNERVEMSP